MRKRQIGKVGQSLCYEGRCPYLLAAMLILALVAPDSVQGQTIKLTQLVKKTLEQAEHALDAEIASPRDLRSINDDITLAGDLAAVRSQEQGADWWETRDAKQRFASLKRIQAMSPDQREQLVEAANMERTVNQLDHDSDAWEPLGHPGNFLLAYVQKRLCNDALEPVERRLQILKGIWGENDPKYATGLTSLANLYYRLGRYELAEPLYSQTLAIRKTTLGKEHPSYAAGLNNLANLYLMQGRDKEAEPLYLQALAIRKEALGAEHPEYATSLNNLGELYQQQGRYVEAEPVYRQALAIRKKTLGEEHPNYLRSMNDLAQLYLHQTRYREAEPLYQQVATIQKSLGEDRPAYTTSLCNLAELYREQGRYGKEEQLILQALPIQERTLGEKNPVYATSLNLLAEAYRQQGRYGEAEPLYQHALVIRKRAFGEINPVYATSLNNLATLYLDEGRYEEAEPLYRRTLVIQEKVLGKENLDYARTLNNLAAVYQHQRRYEEAEPLCRQSLAIRKNIAGEDTPAYAASLNILANLYSGQERYGEAEPLYREALEITKKKLGEDHPTYATTLNNLANLYLAQGKYEEAEPLYRQVSEIRKNALGEDNLDYAAALQGLGVSLGKTQHWSEAAASLLLASQASWLHMVRNLGALTPPQQLRYLRQYRGSGPLWSLIFSGRASGTQGMQNVLWKKQLGLETLRAQSAAMRDAVTKGSPEWQSKYKEWQQWRRDYEALSVSSLGDAPGQNSSNGDYLHDLKQKMSARELELRQTNSAYARLTRLQSLNVEDVQKALRSGEAMVEYKCYRPYDYTVIKPSWGALHYGAFIVRGDRKTVQAVELGEAAGIDALVKQYRDEMDNTIKRFRGADPSPAQLKKSELKLAQISSKLRKRVWDKLDGALSGVKRVYVGPEGQLSLIPLDALARQQPNGTWRYLAEDKEIVYVNTARDLVRLALSVANPQRDGARGRAVLVGAPAFGATPRELAATMTAPQKNGPQFEQETSFVIKEGSSGGTLGAGSCSPLEGELPPTFSDVPQLMSFSAVVGKSLRQHGWRVEALTGRDASKRAALGLQHPDLLQFATHGFFVSQGDNPCKNAAAADEDSGDVLLHSMLILAGYNHRSDGNRTFYRVGKELLTPDTVKARGMKVEDMQNTRIDVGDGVLTAYEVSGMDLDGTRLVNLTACDTGVGKVTPDGVLGLRSGFLLAGARALTMSMWIVPAEETTRQMSDFYDRWLGKTSSNSMPVATYTAFHGAQLAALHRARSTKSGSGHPFYWAGTIYLGDPGDLPPVPSGDDRISTAHQIK